MNDFTKSELTVIHIAVTRDMIQFAHILKTSSSMLKLRDKLETMIDNYCEHQEEYEDLNYSPMRCKKCLEIIE